MKTILIMPVKDIGEEIIETIDNIKSSAGNVDYLLIDYGADDRTKHLLKNNNFQRLIIPIESTYDNALKLGIKYAYENKYDNLIEFNPVKGFDLTDISYFTKTMAFKKVDLLIGSRFVEEKAPHKLRYFYTRLLKYAIGFISFRKVTDANIDLRMINRRTMKALMDTNESITPSSVTYLIRSKHSFIELQIKVKNKKSRQAKFKGLKLAKYIWHQILLILFVQPFKRKGNTKNV
ncbi:hypothetical protein [Candidatus Mycoplasma mahonii]|uniref:hypothetical protein n=1 Tax=Candidatus Mycoplasma mahonii TaxID=3004105 RepID=UPI0026EEFB0C|nr:hypothetical protein [Candidatus Mycoplasma mahonii]WKX02521.1 hypothetical protein O3I44_00365 [Candidatus Mycoplasma mahonii]